MTGELPFTAEESHAIEQTIAVMRQLQSAMPHNLPIDWSQFGRIKPLVDATRKQLQDKTDPTIPRYCVVKLGGSFFQRINAGQILTRPDQVSCAAFEDPALADEVVRELLKLGRRADVQIVPLNRRRSETVQTLSQVGFVSSEAQDAGL